MESRQGHIVTGEWGMRENGDILYLHLNKNDTSASSCQRQTSHDAEGQFMTSEGQLMTEKDKSYRHKALGVRRRANN
jgi:hypothetical protein